MMRSLSLFCLLLAWGCTRDNPLYIGGPEDGGADDLAVGNEPDGCPDCQTDLAGADLFSPPPDLLGVDLAGCGQPGLPCCAGDVCAGGGCCGSNKTCVPSGSNCGANQVCANGTCTACGGTGQTCCANFACPSSALMAPCCSPNSHTCIASGSSCGGGLGMCMDGACTSNSNGTCGSAGDLCCTTTQPNTPNACTSPGTVCAQSGDCATCGGDSEPCCSGGTCESGGCCVNGQCHASGTACTATMCVSGSCGGGTCGGLGQPCCGGATGVCTAGNVRCLSGVCASCGGKDERCCPDVQTGQNIYCQPPFQSQIVQGVCFCK
jgi:hypothetical protein